MTSATPGGPAGCRIVPLHQDHAEALAAAYLRNREHLAPWDPVRPASFFTPAGQRALVGQQLAEVAAGRLAVWLLEHEGEVVGRVALNNVVHAVLCSASLGYWVDAAHLRQGWAGVMVEHACAEALPMGLHRVEAGTLLHNEASQRVLLRAGFEEYGVARQLLYLGGAWQDHRLYQRILHDGPPGGAPPGQPS